MLSYKNYRYIILILLIIASCAAFGRIAGNDFINFDDDKYITENDYIKSGINPSSVKWALTTTYFSYWHPLTWLSHMLDWSLFGANASGHHIVSLILHIGAVVFLFLFLNKTTGNIWSAAFAAAFFALHPLRVESVAMAAERKDVLSMFLAMACLYAYAFYAESNKILHYLLCLILFTLALMSKPMMVTLPFVLLLLDYWPLKRWQKVLDEPANRFGFAGRLIGEKLPLICLSMVASILTFWAQDKGGIVASVNILPFFTRGANAVVSYVVYLEKIFWPANLAVYYPYESSFSLLQILIFGSVLILITLMAIYYIRKLPFLFVGWFWYLGTLIPVIGLIQVGMQAMADRYTYLPSVGIAIILTGGIPCLFPHSQARKNILFPAAITLLIVMLILTWQQCGYWKNSIEIFNHTVRVTKNNYLAHNNLGTAFFNEGKMDEALHHFNDAIRIFPSYADAYNNRGNVYARMGRYRSALEDYNKAIRLQPAQASVYLNSRGNVYANMGQYRSALEDYNQAIHRKEDSAAVYFDRGILYEGLGQYQLAVEDYSKAIELRNNYADAYNNRGNVYAKMGQYRSALEDYNQAIHRKEDFAEAYNNRGIIYGRFGQYHLAIEDFNKAVKFKEDYAEAYNNSGFTYYNIGHYQSAIEYYNKAIKYKPGYVVAYLNRAAAYLKNGNKELGCYDARRACELGQCGILQDIRAKGYCR